MSVTPIHPSQRTSRPAPQIRSTDTGAHPLVVTAAAADIELHEVEAAIYSLAVRDPRDGRAIVDIRIDSVGADVIAQLIAQEKAR